MPERPGDFYVGYLPVPPGLRTVVRRIVLALLGGALFVAGLSAWSQSDPGGAVWDDGHERTWTGRAVAVPYPHLQIDGPPGAVLLVVEMGKFGGGQRLAPFDGQHVRVRGFLLARDGRRMIELAGEADAIVALPTAPAELLPRSTGEVATLMGEVVDSKCYLGAMKPGAGKTHKACATRCVAGGIPPVLVVHADGRRTYYLLTDRDGRRPGDALLPFVGETIGVTGRVGALGGWRTLAIDVAALRRADWRSPAVSLKIVPEKTP